MSTVEEEKKIPLSDNVVDSTPVVPISRQDILGSIENPILLKSPVEIAKTQTPMPKKQTSKKNHAMNTIIKLPRGPVSPDGKFEYE
jgi:hypothetical protein